MKVGDLVKIIGIHGDGPEVTSAVGVIMSRWKTVGNLDGWWVVMMPDDELETWPESQMTRVNHASW